MSKENSKLVEYRFRMVQPTAEELEIEDFKFAIDAISPQEASNAFMQYLTFQHNLVEDKYVYVMFAAHCAFKCEFKRNKKDLQKSEFRMVAYTDTVEEYLKKCN